MSRDRYNNDNEDYDRSVVEFACDDNTVIIGEIAKEILMRQIVSEEADNFHEGNNTNH